MYVTCFGSLEWPGLLETVTVAQSIKSSVKHPSCFYLKLKQDFVHCIVEIGVLTTLQLCYECEATITLELLL